MKLFNGHHHNIKRKILMPFGIICMLVALGFSSYTVSAKLYGGNGDIIKKESLVSPANDKKNSSNDSIGDITNSVGENNTNSVGNNTGSNSTNVTNSTSNGTSNNITTSTQKSSTPTVQNTTPVSSQPKEVTTTTQSQPSSSSTTQTQTASSSEQPQSQPVQQSHGNLVTAKKTEKYTPTPQDIQEKRDKKAAIEAELQTMQNQLNEANVKFKYDSTHDGNAAMEDQKIVNQIESEMQKKRNSMNPIIMWLSTYDR